MTDDAKLLTFWVGVCLLIGISANLIVLMP